MLYSLKTRILKIFRRELSLLFEHPIKLDPNPPLEHYEGDEIEDIRDAENEPPIENDTKVNQLIVLI